MKAEFTDLDSSYHKVVDDITSSDIDELLKEAKDKGGAGLVSLTISRSNKDYINIDYVGKDQYLFQTDRLTKVGTFWQRLIQDPRIVTTVTGHAAATDVVLNYISRDRSEYEALYS